MMKTLKVVGVKFDNPDGSSRQDILKDIYDDYWTEMRENEIVVTLLREPENSYDENAVAVFIETPSEGNKQVGYLSASDVAVISEFMDDGIVPSVSIDDMGAATGDIVWLRIIVDTDRKNTVIDEDGNVYEF